MEQLFGRNELGERHGSLTGDSSPVEHVEKPVAAEKEAKPPMIVFSFETEEQRAELVALLGLTPDKRWTAWWPSNPADDVALQLDF